MLKHNEVNPLAVHRLRRVDFCPAHFVSMTVTASLPPVLNWLHENTDGRFYINNSAGGNLTIGFENHSEATYFSLFLPQIISEELVTY